MESLSTEQKNLAKDILEDILSAIVTLEERVEKIRKADDFSESKEGLILLDATCMLLIAIGESLKNLDKVTAGQLLINCPEIPWKQVKGMRDIVAHHYFDIDAEQVFWIAKNEIVPLKNAVKTLITIVD